MRTGFTQVRGQLDGTVAGLEQITSLLNTLISPAGRPARPDKLIIAVSSRTGLLGERLSTEQVTGFIGRVEDAVPVPLRSPRDAGC